MTKRTTFAEFDSRLYVGGVSHRRLKPVSHQFSYKIFSLLINLDELPELDNAHTEFGYNRFAPLSFYDQDHGPKDGNPLKPWLKEQLLERGEVFELGKVQLLCFPRLFGFVFNPLSVWYCYDTDDDIRAILYEVRNTFGEWRGYLIPVEKGHNSQSIRQSCDKAFYVSPLMDMSHRYNFTLRIPDDKLIVGIRETKADKRTFLAAQTGKALPFKSTSLKKVLLKHPLMYVKIVFGIHYQAIRTLVKGVKFHLNPATKSGDVIGPKNDQYPAE